MHTSRLIFAPICIVHLTVLRTFSHLELLRTPKVVILKPLKPSFRPSIQVNPWLVP